MTSESSNIRNWASCIITVSMKESELWETVCLHAFCFLTQVSPADPRITSEVGESLDTYPAEIVFKAYLFQPTKQGNAEGRRRKFCLFRV